MLTLQSYLGLITSEHADKPNFVGFVTAFIKPLIDAQSLFGELITIFDVDTAIGVQLDAVGQWIGESRQISQPITGVYFSLDTQGLGFDQGVWLGPFDPTSGLVSLPDDVYRSLLYAKIIMNSWDGTIATIAAAINALFSGQPSTEIVVLDNQDMTMTVGIAGNAPASIYLSLLEGGYVPIRPSGVLINYLVTSINTSPNFGLDIENTAISGFDVGTWSTGPTGTAPGQVLGFATTSISGNGVSLSWIAVSIGSGPFEYQVQYQLAAAPGAWILAGLPIFQTEETVVGLSPNTTYNFQVYALNSSGAGPPSTTLVVTTGSSVLVAPTGLAPTATTTTSVTLAWNAVSGVGITYQVQDRITGASTFSNAGSSVTSTSTTITGLTPGVSYDFAVEAENSSGVGPLSSPVTVSTTGTVPGVIQNLAAGTPTTTTVPLSWGQPITGNGPYSYTVQFAQNVVPITYQTFGGTTTVTATGGSTIVTGLQAGLPYLLRVYSTNQFGNGPVSSPVSITTAAPLAGAVPSLSVTGFTSTTANLSWGAATNAATYQMQYQLAGATSWTLSGSPVSGTTGTVTGLTAGTSYNFEVYGLSATSVAGPVSPVASATTTGTLPTQVTGLAPSNPTISSVALEWNASTGAPPVITYQVQYKVATSATWTNFGAPIGTLSAIVSGLQASTSYDFQVYAINSTGNGPVSSTVVMSTTSTSAPAVTWSSTDNTGNLTFSNGNLTVTTNPQTVNSLSASPVTSSSVLVSWTQAAPFGVFGVRGTTAYATGKFFVEYTLTTSSPTFAVGLANAAFNFPNAGNSELGYDTNGLGIFPNAPVQSAFIGGIQLITGAVSDVTGDTVSLAIDFSNNLFWFTTQAMRSVYGASAWNNSATANPSNETGGLSMNGLTPGNYFPAYNTIDETSACTLNAGASAFVINIPDGFTAWNGSGVGTILPPTQVTGLVAGAPTFNSVPLTWTKPTGGGVPTSYQVSFRLTGTTLWYNGPLTTTSNGVVVNLLSSTSYDFQVTAFGQAGAAPVSSIITVSTQSSTSSILTYRGVNLVGSNLSSISTVSTGFPHVNAVVIPVFISTASQTSIDVALTVTVTTISGWVSAANTAGFDVFLAVYLQPRDGSPGSTITPGPSQAGVAEFFQNLQTILVSVAQMGNTQSAVGLWCSGFAPWAGTAAGDTGPYSTLHVAQWQSIYEACKAVWPNGLIAYSAPQTAIGLAAPTSPFSANWTIWDAVVLDIFPGSNNSYLTISQFETFFNTQPDPDPNTQAATGAIPLFQALVNFSKQIGRRLIINSCGIIPADGNQQFPGSRDALPPPFDFLMQSAWWTSIMFELTINVGSFAGFFAYDGGTNGYNSPQWGVDYYGIQGQAAAGNVDSTYAGLTGSGGGGLTAPTNLTVSGQATTSLTLNWSAIAGLSIAYVPQISVHGANSFTSLTAIISTSATFTGLSANTLYDMQVYTQQGAAIGPTSIVITGQTLSATGGQTISIVNPSTPVPSGSAFTVSGILSGFTNTPSLSYIDDGSVANVTGITLVSATTSALSVSWGAITPATQTVITSGVTTTAFSFSHPSLATGNHTIYVTNGTITASLKYTIGINVSPNFATVLAGSSAVITDTSGNTWGISSGTQVLINGKADTTSVNVVELAWVSSIIWYQNTSAIWFSRSSPASAWSSGTKSSPLGDTQIVTVTVPTGIQPSAQFTVTGSLTGYAEPPTLNYEDGTGGFGPLPTGSTVTTTAYSFIHPGVGSGSHSLTIEDVNNAAAIVTTNYTVSSVTLIPVPHPLTGATVGTWQTATLTANGITTTYLYLLPYNYAPTQFTYPILMYLCSTEDSSSATLQTELNGWVNTAAWRDAYPCIVVAPILASTDISSGAYWGGVTTATSLSGANAITILQQFINTYPITANQVYCMGYEYGAIGTWYFAVTYNSQTGTQGKLINAFLPLGGTLYTSGYPTPTTQVQTALANVPIFSIFGYNDQLINPIWPINLYAAYGGT